MSDISSISEAMTLDLSEMVSSIDVTNMSTFTNDGDIPCRENQLTMGKWFSKWSEQTFLCIVSISFHVHY